MCIWHHMRYVHANELASCTMVFRKFIRLISVGKMSMSVSFCCFVQDAWQCVSVVRHVPLRCRMTLRRASARSYMLLATMASLVFATLVFWSSLRYPFTFPTKTFAYPYKIRNDDVVQANGNIASELLSRADLNITPTLYDVTRPYDDADFECVRTRTRPRVTVCLFNVWRDVFISRSLQSDGIWEPYVVDEFVEAVERSDSRAGVRGLFLALGAA
jgi:hypothetical protein